MYRKAFTFLTFTFFSMTILTSLSADEKILTKDDFHLLISADEIDLNLQKMAARINEEYKDKEIVLVMILKGSVCFVTDLLRYLEDPVRLEAITCKSYRGGTERGELSVFGIDNVCLEGKHVIVADDIYDSGRTMTRVADELRKQNPASLKTMVLLDKSVYRDERKYPQPDYSVFTIPNLFVIGYGLDLYEYYRGLRDIYVLND